MRLSEGKNYSRKHQLLVSFIFFLSYKTYLRSFEELHLGDCLDFVTYMGFQSLTKEECCVFIMSCFLNSLFSLAESAELT